MPCGYQVRRTKRRESSLARGSNSNYHQGQLKTGKGVECVDGVVVIVTKEKGTTAATINNSPSPTTPYIEPKTVQQSLDTANCYFTTKEPHRESMFI